MILIQFICLLIIIIPCRSIPVDIQDYMTRYGYIEDKQLSKTSLREALSQFQQTYHLHISGELNDETQEKISTPRCGNKDLITKELRSKRYVLEGTKWKKNKLTYRISKYASSLSKHQVERSFRMAFDQWKSTCALRFRRVGPHDSSADINIQFLTGAHGDNHPFNGVGGMVAHSYYPGYGGDVHLDNKQRWVTGPTKENEINLYQVALHELGHVMGLMHSAVKDAVMQPYYGHYIADLQVGYDDIVAMDYLYNQHH